MVEKTALPTLVARSAGKLMVDKSPSKLMVEQSATAADGFDGFDFTFVDEDGRHYRLAN